MCEKIKMMPYGNDHTRLSGIIRDVQTNRTLVEFPQLNKKLSIPYHCIHNQNQWQKYLNQEQELEIDTWYLKKNRVIPLFEDRKIA